MTISDYKKYILPLIVVAMLLIPLSYYSSKSITQITGHATSNQVTTTPGQKTGEYSTYGMFSVDSKLDTKKYEEMRNTARQFKQDALFCELAKEYSLEWCIDSELNKLNSGWLKDCENEKTKYFYEFVESYKQCAESNDNYCFCDLPINYNNMLQDVEIIVSEKHGTILFEMDDLMEYLYDYVPYEKTPESAINRLTGSVKDYLNNQPNAIIDPIVVPKNKITSPVKFDNNEKYKIFKVDKSMVIMTKKENEQIIDNTLQYDYLDDHDCELPPRRKYKFCVDSNLKSVEYDKNTLASYLEDVKYKFALDFSDKEPPELVQNIISSYYDPNIKDSIKIEWDRVSDIDLDHYKIFMTTNQNADINGLIPIVIKDKTVTSTMIYSYLDKGIYHEINGGIRYYIMIISVDKSNNFKLPTSWTII